ncbi:MAG: ribosome rescue protein RqcH [Thermoplasmatota archaeon]
MQRGLSSFDIYVIVSELQELLGSHIEKIYQPTRDELLIRIRNNTTNKKEALYIKNGELFCLTQKEFSVPQKPSTFAMTCRKYLVNGRITSIKQHEFDRIIIINIGKKEGEYSLIIELFQKGNIILRNPDKKIILPLITQKWSHRILRSHQPYVFPPSQRNPFNLTYSEFIEILKNSNSDIVRTLAVQCNFGGSYAEEICYRANIEKNTKTKQIKEDIIQRIISEITTFLDIFKEKNFTPFYIKNKQEVIDIIPIPFQSYQSYDMEKISSFLRGLEYFIAKPQTKTETKYQQKIQQLQRQLDQQNQSLQVFKQKIQQKKIQGDIIYLNYQSCQQLLDEVSILLKEKQKTQGIEDINSKSIVKHFDPISNELIISLPDEQGKPHEINIDFRKSVSENAEQAYQASKKYQEKLVGAQKAIEQTKDKINTLKEKDIVEKEQKTNKTGKKFWFEHFRWFISKEGNIIIAGKDAKTNEIIVKKYLKESDRYVHADVHGAPSCIVKSIDIFDKNIAISEETLEQACIFAASYSKAWNQFADAQAYWVYPEQVSKTPESGEFLPKGAFIIRGKRNHYRCSLEIALGEVSLDNATKIMAGPVNSIKAHSEKYVILQSGPTDKNSIAKKLSTIFNAPMQTIQGLLPPGGVTIIKTVGFEGK